MGNTMIEPDFDELEKIKYHVLERMQRDEIDGSKVLIPSVSIGAAIVLAFVAYLAPMGEANALLVSFIVGIAILCGLVVTGIFAMTARLEGIQRHLITLHEELLYARSDIRARD